MGKNVFLPLNRIFVFQRRADKSITIFKNKDRISIIFIVTKQQPIIENYLNIVAETCMNAGLSDITPYSDPSKKLLYLYGYYHYFDARDSEVDELASSICYQGSGERLQAIFPIPFEDEEFDVVCSVYSKSPASIDDSFLTNVFSGLTNEFIAKLSSPGQGSSCSSLVSRISKNEKASVTFKLITNCVFSPERKAQIKQAITEIKAKFDTWSYDIVCGDDISEEISDVESPKPFVERGELVLDDPSSLSFHGEERSFMGAISALSLKRLFSAYSTKGLFASNLRYYVKSLKIDDAISNTIKNEGGNFWYFNNGIIITCDDYQIVGKTIILKNFSIANGGQTTNLIGITDFEKDFVVPCKVIKNRFVSNEKKDEFLSDVAEASNTQKPIKARDLISNRIEQKRLQSMMESLGVFVQIKRGDRINKIVYPEQWQNSTNDEIAQLVYSAVYQDPVLARNSKSKLLSTDSIYSDVFEKPFSGLFLKDLILTQAAFKDWIGKKTKKKAFPPAQSDFMKVCLMYMMGIVGFISKLFWNDRLYTSLKTSEENPAKMQFAISQKDIGCGPVFEDRAYEETRDLLFHLFSTIEQNYLIPAYGVYINYYGNDVAKSHANFVRNSNYYRSQVIQPIFEAWPKNTGLALDVFRRPDPEEKIQASEQYVTIYSPGLKQELLDLRTAIGEKNHKAGKDVLSDASVASITKFKPTSEEDLSYSGKLTADQFAKLSDQILAIVRKYKNEGIESIIIRTNTFKG